MEVNHIEGYDCIEDNLRMLLKDSKVDIRRMFNKLWYFSFNKNLDSIREGLMCANDNKYKKLKENFNIGYEIYENKNKNKGVVLKNFGKSKNVEQSQINKIIRAKCSDKNIVILEVKTFDYEYDKGFRKYIGTHSCVITKINKETAQIIDVWYKLYNQKTEYKKLLNAITRIIVLETSNIEEKKFEFDELSEVLLDEKSINEMKEFFVD